MKDENFLKVFKINMPTLLLGIGILAIFLAAVIKDKIDKWLFIGAADATLNIGSAMVGAGVFSAVTNSKDFTKIFENHIFNVLYKPDSIYNTDDMLVKWNILTQAILRQVLPSTYTDASKKIEEKFFNNELEYHFENYSETYEIKIEEDLAVITLCQEAMIVKSPNIEQPKLMQYFRLNSGDSDIKLESLYLNDLIQTDANYVNDGEDSEVLKLEIALNDFTSDRIKMVKNISFKQNLKVDPYVKSDISRFVKGFTVDVNAPDDYEIRFKAFGVDIGKKPMLPTDTGIENTQKWVLAKSEELLIPGQGYIFLIIKKP